MKEVRKESEFYDFKSTEVIKNVSYLSPGQYVLTVRSAEYIKPEGKKTDGSAKTPYLDVTFGGDSGEVGVKFYITPKAIARLQTIYTDWFGINCDKLFESTDAVGAFFEKAFTSEKAKKTYKRMMIGGKQAQDGKIYAELPYSNYIVPDNAEGFIEGPFEKDSIRWIQYVKMNPANPSSFTDETLIPSRNKVDYSDDLSSDLPF